VSEADSVLFGRAELERAFTALGERLVRRGVVADIFIVGGAAMALPRNGEEKRKSSSNCEFNWLHPEALWKTLHTIGIHRLGLDLRL
jgi:hypothetical protein